jgi:flagellar biosynthetic protein FliQ
MGVVPKLGAAAAALVLAGPWISGQLVRFTHQLLLAIAEVAS